MSILRDNINLGPAELRKQIRSGFVIAAGVYNSISAMQAERAGFRTLYLSGSGVAACMGLPDLSFTTLTEVVSEVSRITDVTKSPLIVDVDTGFGEPLNVTRTVRQLEKAGASAMHLEDQQLPKKCGHLSGKKIVPDEEMVHKIRAAVSARHNEDFLIIARTDARSVFGVEDAIRRSNLYLESGADMIFTEALESEDEFRRFAREVRGDLLANMTEYGKSPLLSADMLRQIGYRAVIFPLTAFRISMKATQKAYEKLFSQGTQKNLLDIMMSRNEFYEVIGYHEYEKEDNELAGDEHK
ncbi:MAG: methylisocitrate lyase [Candidatus Thermoplasmatota archaeon]|nr:methylisocitrate lyase [Candidatus Thermoplasmatota archaeon]